MSHSGRRQKPSPDGVIDITTHLGEQQTLGSRTAPASPVCLLRPLQDVVKNWMQGTRANPSHLPGTERGLAALKLGKSRAS